MIGRHRILLAHLSLPVTKGLKFWYDGHGLPYILKKPDDTIEYWLSKGPVRIAVSKGASTGGFDYDAVKKEVYFNDSGAGNVDTVNISLNKHTLFVVSRLDTNTKSQGIVELADAGGVNTGLLLFCPSGGTITCRLVVDGVLNDITGSSQTVDAIHVSKHDGATWSYSTNLTLNGSVSLAGTLTTVTKLALGKLFTSSYGMIGGIQEIVHFDRALSTAEEDEVKDYLNNKHNCY